RDNAVALVGIEREIRVARKAGVAAMRRDDLIEHAKGAVVAIRRSRPDAPEPGRQKDVAFDKTLSLQLVAERVDRLVDDEMALEVAIKRDQPLALVVSFQRPGEGQGAQIN